MDLLAFATTVEDQVIDVLSTVENLAVDAFTTVAGAVEPVTAAVPALPFAATLPAPDAVVDHVVDFAVRVLENQRAYAHKLIAAAAPVLAAPAPAPAPTLVTEPKPAASKSA